jgi:hypothetical protein
MKRRISTDMVKSNLTLYLIHQLDSELFVDRDFVLFSFLSPLSSLVNGS